MRGDLAGEETLGVKALQSRFRVSEVHVLIVAEE